MERAKRSIHKMVDLIYLYSSTTLASGKKKQLVRNWMLKPDMLNGMVYNRFK